jgi:dihydroorotase
VTDAFDLLIRGGMCVTPSGVEQADVGVRAGSIAAIGALAHAPAVEIFEARGLHVLPGIIDTHVHFREPGHLEKEDMETGSRAALLGGVTAVFEMPNTSPPTTTEALVADKLARAQGRMHCDHAFYVGASMENLGALAALEKLPGVAGVKAFLGSSTGTLLLDREDAVAAALRSGHRRMSVHSEDEARLKARAMLAMPGDPATHPVWRDVETALLSTARVLRLARAAGRRLHLLHLTSAEELPLLARARDFATAEAAVPHLTLAAPDCYARLGTYAQINPPIREARHREALWAAVRDGLIDVVGSDHAPHNHADKQGIYPHTASGLTGVQTLLPLMLDHVRHGRLTLERLCDLLAAGPARVFGIAGKGRIARGYDADFAIVDLARAHRIVNAEIASRCGWTPYDGMEVTGWPVATVLRGRVKMRDGAVSGAADGIALRFVETLASRAVPGKM